MNRSTRRHATSFLKKSCLSVLVAFALTANANAQESAQQAAQYAISAGDLVQVVNEISRSSGVQIVYDIELLRGKQAAEVRGAMTLEQALDRALSGSGLIWERVSQSTISIQRKPVLPNSLNEGMEDFRSQDQENGARQEIHEMDDVVVVGSRLGVSPVESAMPVKVITRDQIDRSGAGSIAQVLSYLSEVSVNNLGDRDVDNTGVSDGGNINSSTVQMRGLPRGTTLVLINGRRAGDSAALINGGQFDLSTIPLALVERVEVLPAGASAVYGGDGLSGVINIVLRRDASGMEMRVRRSYADGYGSSQVSLMWGKAWSRGDLTVAANWRENDALFSDERALTANQDYRRLGGNDLRTGYTSPGTLYTVPCISGFPYCDVEDRRTLPGLDSPVAVVPAGQDGTDLTPGDFIATQGEINKASTKRHLISAEKSQGLTLNGRFEIKPDYEVFAELMATRRTVPAYQLPLILQKESSEHRVLASHPFNPFGVDVGFDYRFNETGLFTSYAQNHYRGLMGLRGKTGRFDWEVSGWKAKDETRSDGGRRFDQGAIAKALASPDPGSVLNPFVGDGGAPASHELLASMLSPLDHDASTDTSGITGFIRGPLVELSQGKVLGLLGLEHQKQTIDIDSNNTSLVTRYLQGSSKSRAVFTELRVPVLGPRHDGALERVAVTGALRRENSDRFESATRTEVVGLEMRPVDSLLLRATYSTAFKPLVANLAVRDPVARMQPVSDPKFGGALFTANVVSLGGVPPELKPERSTTRTMGAIWRPTSDLSLSVTHWDIRFRDRIAGIDPQTILSNEADYPGRVIRDPATGIVSEIDSRQVNISLMESAGLDLDIDGYWSTAIGDFHPALSATYTYRYQEQRTADSPMSKRVSIYGSTGWAPRWKIVPRLGWEYRGQASAMLAGRYVSRYENQLLYSATSAPTNLGDFWVFDLNLDLNLGRIVKNKFMSGTKLSLGTTNILNRLPDFCVACGISGYDPSQYDIVGRTVYAEIRVGF